MPLRMFLKIENSTSLRCVIVHASCVSIMRVVKNLWLVITLFCLCLPVAAAQQDYAQHIASLIGPVKLATRGPRSANPPRASHPPEPRLANRAFHQLQ
jgi:hypothetical protein